MNALLRVFLSAGHVGAALGALFFETGYPALMGRLVTAIRADALPTGPEALSTAHASSPTGVVLTPAPTEAPLSSAPTTWSLASWYHRVLPPQKIICP